MGFHTYVTILSFSEFINSFQTNLHSGQVLCTAVILKKYISLTRNILEESIVRDSDTKEVFYCYASGAVSFIMLLMPHY